MYILQRCNIYVCIIDHVFLPHDKVRKIYKIWSLLSKSGFAIQFLFKFCFTNHDYNVKIIRDLIVQFSVLAKVANNEHADLILCAWFAWQKFRLLFKISMKRKKSHTPDTLVYICCHQTWHKPIPFDLNNTFYVQKTQKRKNID